MRAGVAISDGSLKTPRVAVIHLRLMYRLEYAVARYSP